MVKDTEVQKRIQKKSEKNNILKLLKNLSTNIAMLIMALYENTKTP